MDVDFHKYATVDEIQWVMMSDLELVNFELNYNYLSRKEYRKWELKNRTEQNIGLKQTSDCPGHNKSDYVVVRGLIVLHQTSFPPH